MSTLTIKHFGKQAEKWKPFRAAAATARMKAFSELIVMPTCNTIVNKSMIRAYQFVSYTLHSLNWIFYICFQRFVRNKCMGCIDNCYWWMNGGIGAFVWSCSGKPPTLQSIICSFFLLNEFRALSLENIMEFNKITQRNSHLPGRINYKNDTQLYLN